MVQASTELLGGAAVTVFLALLFFGVVVLWDVALALRSVGDKIDKLEDNIDDDLTDIAHSLDGMSNAPGGNGGGTQLHLSGGTISSGATGPQQQTQQTQQAAAGAQGAATGGQNPVGGPHPDPGQQRPEQRAEAARREPDGDEAGSVDDEPTATPEPDEPGDADEADPATADDEEPAPDEPESPGNEAAAADEATDHDADEAEPHPHAERNRGRFITSPDRTAWYVTPLDRETINAAQPSIAGALPDGSEPEVDESEIIAAGPGDADESVDAASDGGATAAGSGTAPDADDEPVASTDDASADERTAAESDDGTNAEREADTAAINESDPTPSEPDAESVDADVDASDADPVPDSPEDIDVLSFDDSDEPADGPDGDADTVTDLERPTDDGDDAVTKPETADSDADDGIESTSEPPTADADAELPDSGPEPSDGEAEPTGLAEFEFDAEEFEADDVTVEEAVDTMNEDAPAPELSSHRFDVTAEEADGSAIVTLEFGADTVDIMGSTKRLLQYQMQSFADRESTPEGEVTIDRDRIVIEIPDSDGAAVTQWGEAAVSIVDRTLYLSDNSS